MESEAVVTREVNSGTREAARAASNNTRLDMSTKSYMTTPC